MPAAKGSARTLLGPIKSTVNNYEIGSPIPSIHTEEFDLLLNNIAADDCVREDDFVSLPMTKSILHTCWLSPNLEPLVVLAVAVLDDVHQLEVGHVALDQAVDDPL